MNNSVSREEFEHLVQELAEIRQQLSQQRRPLIDIAALNQVNWKTLASVALTVFVAGWTAMSISGVAEVRDNLYQLNNNIGELNGHVQEMGKRLENQVAQSERRLEEKIDRNTELLEKLANAVTSN